MKNRAIVIPLAVAAAATLTALAVYLVPRLFDTTLTFKFEDAVSKSWVWDATATLEGREIRSFYQSSTGPVAYTFTNLKPGKATLEIKAPDYETIRKNVTIAFGRNLLARPIEMVGYRIPNLARFIMFEERDNSGLSVQVRPVNSAGHAITVMPCLDLWIGALVSAEMKGGELAAGPAKTGATRGATLYRGSLPWKWDPAPSQVFRYSTGIRYAQLSDQAVPELVVDYLVVVPDPRKISMTDISSIMRRAPDFESTGKLVRYLDREKGNGRFRYYLTTSWNVPGPEAP